MSPFVQKLGIIAFWLTWPGIWLLLRFSTRTRVYITSGQKVLVVKPWLGNGRWSLAGGGIHRGEAPEAAAIREVCEETGVIIDVDRLEHKTKRVYKQMGFSFKYYEYQVKLPSILPVVRQKGELAAAAWIDKQDLSSQNANSDVLTALSS